MLSDQVVTSLLAYADVAINIFCIFLGFKLGRTSKLPVEKAPEREKKEKEQPPYVEKVTDDPWNEAMTEEIPQDKKKPKIVGGM